MLQLYVTSPGRLLVESSPGNPSKASGSGSLWKIERAVASGENAGLLHLATVDFKAALPPSLVFAHSFAQLCFTHVCHLTEAEIPSDATLVVPPDDEELD
jgi:hypothetical protein